MFVELRSVFISAVNFGANNRLREKKTVFSRHEYCFGHKRLCFVDGVYCWNGAVSRWGRKHWWQLGCTYKRFFNTSTLGVTKIPQPFFDIGLKMEDRRDRSFSCSRGDFCFREFGLFYYLLSLVHDTLNDNWLTEIERLGNLFIRDRW